jgi:hypothetical protein
VTRFRYVDFAAAAQPGFRNNVVAVEAVEALVERFGREECFASIFRFSDEILLYLAENQVGGRPSIAGYDGRIWAPFLPLDIDALAPADLGRALDLTRRILRLLRERWTLPQAAVHPYFSGGKGFHLLVDTRVFGRVAPARELHRVFSRLRLEVLRALPESERALFDLSIGDKVRLLRLPNTRHRKSGLYKVALDEAEVAGAGVERILALARSPRPLRRVGAAGLVPLEPVQAVPAAQALYARVQRAVRRARGPHPYRFAAPPTATEHALCAARRAMWDSPIAPGSRNNAAIRLASAFRLAGYGRADTQALLLAWNRRQHRPLPEREIRAVVGSAYARPYPYAYGCHDEVIRSFCPFVGRLEECEDYREQHARSGRRGWTLETGRG